MDVPRQLQDKLGATYTFHREMGGGGMARVFLAEDTRLNRKVVVKILAQDLASQVSAERFEREIRTAAALQQANIVPLLDAGDAGGVAYFTMPYVEGESLRARLEKSGSLSVPEVVSILRDVARALAYAHEHGVVHRDIKPDNILLSGATAVVTDFGIAKAVDAARHDGAKESTITSLGTAVGTPPYMAPEQIAADPHVDERADIYALGCTAYEMLTGAPPFVGRSIAQILAAHMELDPRDVRQLRPKIPPALGALVMQCLEKNPADRPSANDVLQRLESISGMTMGVSATPANMGVTKRAFSLYAAAFVAVAALARIAVSLTGLPDWVFAGALIVMALGLPVLILTAIGTSRHLSWKRAALGGVMALASFMVIVAGYMVLRSLGIGPAGSLLAAGRIQPKQPVLVADFRSLGADSTLGSVVGEAIRADLNQSNVVKIVAAPQISAALQRMQRPPSTRLDYTLAQELAKREGIGAIVDGEIRPLGGGFLVSIRLTQTDSGEILASFQETADSPTQLIATLGTLSKKLRRKIGESLKNVRESAPLERVTTASLPALQKHTEAQRAMNEQDFARFVRNEEEAIALDSGFAMAYRRLGTELRNQGGQPQRAEFMMKKAVDHAERLSPIERYLAIASYALMPEHTDRDRALDALDRVLEIDPSNAAALNNTGIIYADRRDWKRAEEAYLRAKAADPQMSTPYLNLMFAKFAQGGLPAVQDLLAEMQRRFPKRPLTTGMAALAVNAAGMPDSAASVFASRYDPRAQGGPSEPAAFTVAAIRATQGRIAESLDWYRKWNQVRANRGARGTDVELALDRAWLEGWQLGRPERAARIADSLVASQGYKSLSADERPYDFVASVYAMAGRADRARGTIAEAERAGAVSPNRPSLSGTDDRTAARHTSVGWIALAENRNDDALREFRAADVGDCVTCALPLIAIAHDRAERADSAIASYKRYLDALEFFRDADRDFLAPTYKRLGELYEARGDKQQAASYYLKFVELWKNADAPLQPIVAEVRKRLTHLKDTERP